MYYSRKLEYEKELLKNDDGATQKEKHGYLVGIYYEPKNQPPPNPYIKTTTQQLKEEIIKLEKEEREEKRQKLAEELNNFSDEFIDKLLAIIKPVNVKA